MARCKIYIFMFVVKKLRVDYSFVSISLSPPMRISENLVQSLVVVVVEFPMDQNWTTLLNVSGRGRG